MCVPVFGRDDVILRTMSVMLLAFISIMVLLNVVTLPLSTFAVMPVVLVLWGVVEFVAPKIEATANVTVQRHLEGLKVVRTPLASLRTRILPSRAGMNFEVESYGIEHSDDGDVLSEAFRVVLVTSTDRIVLVTRLKDRGSATSLMREAQSAFASEIKKSPRE